MKFAALAANTQVNAVAVLLNGGSLALRDAKGAVLAQLTFGDVAFKPAADGKAQAHPITSDPDARATGTPVSYQLITKAGEVLGEGTAGTAEGSDLVLASESIQQHAEVLVEDFVLEA